jgi:HEAT repeat protein
MAQAAGELVALEARDALRALTVHDDAYVRETAFSALARVAEHEDIPRFIAGLADGSLQADEISRDALIALGPPALAAVAALVQQDPNGDIPLSAIEVLAAGHDDSCVSALKLALHNSDPTVREWVIKALAAAGTTEALEALEHHISIESDPDVRDFARAIQVDASRDR